MRDDPVLSHCSFRARQNLGVVATLEPAGIYAIAITEERSMPYSMCQINQINQYLSIYLSIYISNNMTTKVWLCYAGSS